MTLELKNAVVIQGTLHSVDQFLNFKVLSVKVLNAEQYPHLEGVRSLFIRGSVIRYVLLSKADVNTSLLQDSSRVQTVVLTK